MTRSNKTEVRTPDGKLIGHLWQENDKWYGEHTSGFKWTGDTPIEVISILTAKESVLSRRPPKLSEARLHEVIDQVGTALYKGFPELGDSKEDQHELQMATSHILISLVLQHFAVLAGPPLNLPALIEAIGVSLTVTAKSSEKILEGLVDVLTMQAPNRNKMN